MPNPFPPSLYAATAIPGEPSPPLQGTERTSIAIVGGGFTGLSAALHLAEAGDEVVLLEANEPGWGASGRNGGQVNPGLKADPDQVERDFGPDLGGRMVAFAWAAPDALFALVSRLRIDCAASPTGTLRAARRAASLAALEATCAQCARRGRPVEMLDRFHASAATGTERYAGALLDRSGGHVNPLSLARGLATAARRAGARVYGGSPVLAMAREGGYWVLTTPAGQVRAEAVLLATNGYTGNLWPRLRRSIVPVFSGIAATAPLAPDLAREVMPARSALYEVGPVTVYYRIDDTGRLLMGGRCGQAEASGPGALRWLTDEAVRLWPRLRGVAWTHGWSGQVAMTADHYPHVHEPAPGVLACLGYNGRGVALATALGPALARRLTGTAAEIDLPITRVRPIPLHALWKPAVTALLAWGRLRDAFGV